jgi:3-methyladenine DNA glycosylase/8-oxoguanine DNA glycosylase
MLPDPDAAYLALKARDAKRVAALAEPWQPWRAYALMRLWQHVETT